MSAALRQFVERFLEHHGAELRRSGALTEVELSAGLEEAFGRSNLKLSFSSPALDDAEPVEPGSYVLEVIHRHLRDRGRRLRMRLPARHAARRARVSRLLTLTNGALGTPEAVRCFRHEVYFNLQLTYLSDERVDALRTVVVDDEGRVWEPSEPLEMVEGARLLKRRHHNDEELGALALLASRFASRQGKRLASEMAASIHGRLYQTILRMRRYYEDRLREVPRGDPARWKTSTDLIDDEYAHKLAEEIENHRQRLVIRLISWAEVETPWVRMEFPVRGNGPEWTYSFFFNQYAGIDRPSPCASCGERPTTFAACAGQHAACPDCASECSVCNRTQCRTCGVDSCLTCESVLCKRCETRCCSCERATCAAHSSSCARCTTTACEECGRSCSRCGEFSCQSHWCTCSLCDNSMCVQCRLACVRCDALVCSDHVRNCSFCGMSFCPSCTEECDECGRQVCQSHAATCAGCGKAGCLRHAGLCDTCGEPRCVKHAVDCAKCGVASCPSCGRACKYCAEVVCSMHAVRCWICRVDACEEHGRTCATCCAHSCMEHCFECLPCGNTICSAHGLRCDSCREYYCNRCMPSAHLCSLCSRLPKGRLVTRAIDRDALVPVLPEDLRSCRKWRTVGVRGRTLVLSVARPQVLLVLDGDGAIVRRVDRT